MGTTELYDHDYYEWTVRNAELLRSGRTNEADLEHIAEELESMGRRERRELSARLAILLGHLLKWQAQPERRSRSWKSTIGFQRKDITKLLADMPSLRRFLANEIEDAYERAVVFASIETDLPIDDFPATCPFTLDQILDPEYLP